MSKPGCKPYKWVKAPAEHPYATKKGLIQQHRLVAETMVDRYLKPEEVVHHIDGNTLNNDVSNLMIFATAKEHNAFHLGGAAWSNDLIIWHSSNVLHVKKCDYCGKLYIPKDSALSKIEESKYCSKKCMDKSKFIKTQNKIPEIINLIYKNNGNFSKTAKIIGITSTGLSKILKTHGEKYHSKDYKNIF